MVIESNLLVFPTDYPIKIVGRPSAEFRATVQAIIVRHAPDTTAAQMTERLSANGNFLSLSYNIRAVSREQVIALATELSACELVLMVL